MEREIDLDETLEASCDGKKWFNVVAIMCGFGGQVVMDEDGYVCVAGIDLMPVKVRVEFIRNKPEKLECYANFFPDGSGFTYPSREIAERNGLGCHRIAVHMVETDDD